MIDWVDEAPAAGPPHAAAGGMPREAIFSQRALRRDAETSAAASMANGSRPAESALAIAEAKLRRVAADIARSVEARLPGRVRDLKVRVESDQFVLSGVSSSYYVKQVAQHVAMNALDALMLGRLVNEIEVRSVR
jgi:hypothetical protein